MRTPPQVLKALRHVQTFYPFVDTVFFSAGGTWLYCDSDFRSPAFGKNIDPEILEDALASVPELPAAYYLPKKRS